MRKFFTLFIAFIMVCSLTTPVYAYAKDKTSPVAKVLSPYNNEMKVPVNKTISINFSENILKGKAFSKITLVDADGYKVSYKVKISKKQLSIKAIANFENDTKYKLTLPKGTVKDKSGNSTKKATVLNFKTTTSAISKGTKLSIKDIAKKAESVVYIEVQDSSHEVFASGSGFVVDGKIVTNYHVIDGASYAIVTANDGEEYNVVGVYDYDKTNDIAVLKIDNNNIPTVVLGDSNKVEVGETIVAIGSPIGLQNTVSVGIISGLRSGDSSSIQISAPINHGSSGGALFDEYGNVVGITSAIYETTGDLNFAIPINIAKPMLSSNTVTSLDEVYNETHVIEYNNATYEGDIVNGEENGFGVIYWDTGDKYIGEWRSGEMNGQGVFTGSNGETITGTWLDGNLISSEDDKISKPTGIYADAISSSEIQIGWNKVNAAEYYYVYYSDSINGQYNCFENTDGSKKKMLWYSGYSAKLYNISSKQTQYFKVTAVKDGVESDYSNVVSATTY